MDTQITRRRFIKASACTAGALLAACAPAPQPTKPAPQATAAQPGAQATKPAAPGAQVKVQFMWWPVGGDRGLKAMDAAMKPFEDANANITLEKVPVAVNYFDKLLTMFAGGTPPDVCAIDNYNITEVADKGVLMDLGPIIEKDKGFSLDAFFPAALKEGMWKGKRWALPYIGSTRILFYNIDLIQKKGLETPDKLWEAGKWTWDTFLDYAQKLTDRSGGAANTVYGCSDDRNWGAGGLSPWIWGAKGEILNEDMTKVLFNQPAAVAGLKFMQDLIFKHQVAPKADAMKDIDLPATGRVAMWFNWRGLSVGYRAYPYKWDVVPFPVGALKTTLYKGNSMAIAKDTKVLDQAWMVAKHITGKEADGIFVGNGGATPRKDNRDVLMKSTPPQNNQYFYDPLNEGWTKMLPLNPRWRQWTTETQKYLDRIFLDGEDVQKVMNECAPAIEKILNEK